VEGDQLCYTEEQVWGRLMEALELRMKMVGQEVKTMEAMAQHSGRQWERAQALNSVVIEVLRAHLAGTDEGKRTLIQIADELEQRVREMQAEDTKLGLPVGRDD
jgi:excinuclease UvrABC helicase subunit UvrB